MQIIKCPSCGKTHGELPAIGFSKPYYYQELSEEDKNNIAKVSEDFCVIRHEEQTDRFIRAVLSIETFDACENLEYGLWVSLSKKSFDDYISIYNEEVESRTYFGRICNSITDYQESTLGIPVNVCTRNNGARPEVIPHKGEHQLIHDFFNGISIVEAEKRLAKVFGK